MEDKTMKKIMIWSSMLLICICACEKQPIDNTIEKHEVNPEEIVFTGVRESISPATRTVPAAGGSVSWAMSDEIGVWDGTNYVKATTLSVSGSSVTFSATVDAGASEYVIVSPYECGKPSGSFAIDGSGNVTVSTGGSTQSAGTQVVSIAKVTSLSTPFTFKNVGNLLRFKVEKAGVVKAKFVGNASEIIAGTLAVNPSTGAVVSSDLTEGEITVDVTVGEDNFIALPAGLNLASGFTITLYGDAACTDYQGEIHPATAVAFTGEKARNRMLNLGVVDGWIDNYLLWEAGKPITIAGNSYTKAGTGFSGTLLKPTDADVDLYTYLYNKEGCFFLEDNAGYAFTSSNFINAGTSTVEKNILLISRYDNKTATFTPTRHISLINGNFQAKGIEFIMDTSVFTTDNSFFRTGANKKYGNLHLDGCKLTFKSGTKNFIIYNHTGILGINSIKVVNTKIETRYVGRVELFKAAANNHFEDMDWIEFDNDLFYSSVSGGVIALTNMAVAPASGSQSSVFKVTNSTFYDVFSNTTLIQTYSAGSITISNNIFYCSAANATATRLVYSSAETGDYTYTISSNICSNYTYAQGLRYFNPNAGVYKAVTTAVPSTNETVFTSADTATGTFVKAPAFAAYGANL